MTPPPDHPTGNQDESVEAVPPASPRPPGVLQGYPPEAAPESGEDTVPVEVPGEQTDPARRLDVFPEDDAAEPAG